MDVSNHGGVTTEQILAILGAKEVEIQMLRLQVSALSEQLVTAQRSLAEAREEAT